MDIECDQSMHDVISLMLSNITENIPIIQEVGPPPMEENITETEKYIDAVFTDAKVINFKKEIINKIENSINSSLDLYLTKLNNILSEQKDMYETTQKENNSYKLLATNLEKEVEFMRREISHKNKLIESLLGKVIDSGDNAIKSHEIVQNPLINWKGDIENISNNAIDLLSSTPSPDEHCYSIETPQMESETAQELHEGKINEQLISLRKKFHENYLAKKNDNSIDYNINDPDISANAYAARKWPPKTTLIVGDSIIRDIDERRLSGKGRNIVKVRVFLGASVDDMNDHIKPLLKKHPENIILHIGTNSCSFEKSQITLDKILSLKHNIKKVLPNCNLVISKLIDRYN